MSSIRSTPRYASTVLKNKEPEMAIRFLIENELSRLDNNTVSSLLRLAMKPEACAHDLYVKVIDKLPPKMRPRLSRYLGKSARFDIIRRIVNNHRYRAEVPSIAQGYASEPELFSFEGFAYFFEKVDSKLKSLLCQTLGKRSDVTFQDLAAVLKDPAFEEWHDPIIDGYIASGRDSEEYSGLLYQVGALLSDPQVVKLARALQKPEEPKDD